MTLKEIKVGETYNVRMYVSHYSKGIISCSTVIGYDEVDGIQCGEEYDICHDEIAAFFPITPENGTKNTATAPKYDPCRLFKKGDKVRVVECNGRDYKDYDPYSNIQKSELYTVLENESEIIDGGCGDIIIGKDNIEHETLFCFLELITPVEELEPYCVKQGCEQESMVDTFPYWSVVSSGCEVARFYSEQYEDGKAKEAAEAECARLNAEYRKERNNE